MVFPSPKQRSRKSKLQFIGILQDEYKTGENPRRQILAQNTKNMFQLPMHVSPWSRPAVSTQPKVCASTAVTMEGLRHESLTKKDAKNLWGSLMPFRPVHGQEHQCPACSCSSLVSTRLTLGKYSQGQTLLPNTDGNKASVSEVPVHSLSALTQLFPRKVKINLGHRHS